MPKIPAPVVADKTVQTASVAVPVAMGVARRSVWAGYDKRAEQEANDIEHMYHDANRAVAQEEEPLPYIDPFSLGIMETTGPAAGLQTPEQAELLKTLKASNHAVLSAPEEGQVARDLQADVKTRGEGKDAVTKGEKLFEGRPELKLGKFTLVNEALGRVIDPTGAVKVDISEGIRTVGGAALDALSETFEGLNVITMQGEDSAFAQIARGIPKIAPSNSAANNMARGLLQYGAVFVPALGATKVALGSTLAKTGKVAPVATSIFEGGIPGAVADWFSMDGDDASLAEIIEEHVPGIKDTPFYTDFMQYVTSDPDDTEAMKRWKNVAEGGVLSVLSSVAISPRKALNEFMAVADGVQRTNSLRRFLGNEMGSVGRNLNPESSMPLIRGQIAQHQAELDRLRLAEQTAPASRQPHIQQRIAEQEEALGALAASQEATQSRIVTQAAGREVEAVSAKAAGLGEKVAKAQARVDELKAGMGPNPNNAAKNRLSRAKLSLRRKTAEFDEVTKSLAEQEGALASAIRGEAPAEQVKQALPDTKVVGPEGKPLRVFHGTGATFEKFDAEKLGTGAGGDLYGKGFYFTESPEIASDYAVAKTRTPDMPTAADVADVSPNVRPVYLDIKNPLDLDATVGDDLAAKLADAGHADLLEPDMLADDVWTSLAERLGAESGDPVVGKQAAQDLLKGFGYDGFKHEGGKIMGDTPHQVWIAFDEGQIKSGFMPMEVKPVKVPSIFLDPATPGTRVVNPLSKRGTPLSQPSADWVLANQDLASQMDVPVRDQLSERVAQYRRKGAGAEAELNRMTKEYGIPLEDLNKLVPGEARSVEEQAGMINLLVDLEKRVKSLSDAWANSPADRGLMEAWESGLHDMNKAYSAYLGAGAEAGRSLQAQAVFDKALSETDVGRIIDTMKVHGAGVSADEKLKMAKLMSLTPVRKGSQFRKVMAKMLGKGNKWIDAGIEAFVSTRFTPLTLSKNIVSTGVHIGAGVTARVLAGMASGLRLPGTGGSNVTVTEGIKMAQGVFNSIGDAFRLYGELGAGFKPSIDWMDMATRMESPRVPALSSSGLEIKNKPIGAFVDGMGYMTRFFTRHMVTLDQVFQVTARGGQRQALAWREATKTVRDLDMFKGMGTKEANALVKEEYEKILADFPAHLEKDVQRYGEYTTFADAFDRSPDNRGSFDNLGDALTSFVHAHPMVKLLFPFVRTNVRIAQTTAKYGLPGLGALVKDTEQAITRNPADAAAINWGKQGVGAATAAMGMYMAYNKMIIGEMPGRDDPKGRELWQRNGWQPLSLVVEKDEDGLPKKSIPLRGVIEPLGSILRMSTDATQIMQGMYEKAESGELEGKWLEEAGAYMGMYAATMLKVTEDQLFFSHLTKLMSQAAQGDSKAMAKYIGNLTPAMARQAAELMDPYTREMLTFGDIIKASMPGFRDNTAVEYNLLGEPYVRSYGTFEEEAPPGMASMLLRDTVPFMVQGDFGETYRPVWNFMLNHADMEVGLMKVRQLDGVKLTPEQVSAYMRIRGGGDIKLQDGRHLLPITNTGTGETLKEALLDVVTTPEYGDDEDGIALRRTLFKATVRSYSDAAKDAMWQAWPELLEKSQLLKIENAQKGGM